MRRVVADRLRPPVAPAAAGLLPSSDHLERARGLASRFPALRAVSLIRAPFAAPANVWLALESMQLTGSFKVRGALLAMEALAARGADDVVAASAGNHGIGVAYAAKAIGIRATVVVPRGAPKTKTDKIAAYGARVVVAQSTGYDDAEAEAIELARSTGRPFLSPYDDLDVLTGNGASLGFEIERALGRRPARVLAPIGGGGLTTGLACAYGGAADPSRVWGVQSEASCAFAQSLERGAAVTTLPPAVTLAEGLEGGISERGFARARVTLAGAIVVTEEEIARAMKVAHHELGLALEGSAAVALAPVLDAAEVFENDTVVVLTGRNVDPERLAQVVC